MLCKSVKLSVYSTLTILLALLGTNAFAAAKKPTFKISKVTVPETVKQGTKSFSMTVRLSGTPTFPVTMAYYPRACPKGCTIGNLTFLPMFVTYATKTDKLVVKKIQACKLIDAPDPVLFDYAVSVKDKKGVIAKPVNKSFSCLP